MELLRSGREFLRYTFVSWYTLMGGVFFVGQALDLFSLSLAGFSWFADLELWEAILLTLVPGTFAAFHKIRNERDELTAELDVRSRRLDFKAKLAEAIAAGEALHANKKVSVDEAEHWATNTNNLISAALGAGEAQLFQSDAGYTFYSGQSSAQQRWVLGRLKRLNELMARCDSLNFSPAPVPRRAASSKRRSPNSG